MAFLKRSRAAVLIAVVMVLILTSSAMAQNTSSDGYKNARRLGGSTSFYKPPLTTPASVRRMATAAT